MSDHKEDNEETPTTPLMTQQDIARTLRKIDKALFGDKYNHDEFPGFISLMTELHKDFYGHKPTGRAGAKEKVDKLWEWRIKIVGICGALSVIAWAIEMFIQYKSK